MIAKQIGKKFGKKLSDPGELKEGFGKKGEDIDYDGIPDNQDEKNGWEYDYEKTKKKHDESENGKERLKKALEDYEKEKQKQEKEKQKQEKEKREKEKQEKEKIDMEKRKSK